jgi:hypothetical protein
MLTVTPSAASYLKALVSASGVTEPVVNIVAGSERAPVSQELLQAIQSGDSKKLAREAAKAKFPSTKMKLRAHIYARDQFGRRNLVEVEGLTFVVPLYLRLVTDLRIDFVDGELTFTDRRGNPILPDVLPGA